MTNTKKKREKNTIFVLLIMKCKTRNKQLNDFEFYVIIKNSNKKNALICKNTRVMWQFDGSQYSNTTSQYNNDKVEILSKFKEWLKHVRN